MAETVSKIKINEVVNAGSGINLIPPVSKEEVVVEEKKSRFNLAGVLAIFLFVLVSVGIVGYNIYTKATLNNEKSKLYSQTNGLEQQAAFYADTIIKNNQNNQRIKLFDTVSQDTISYKQVLDYWQNVSKTLAQITNVRLSNGLAFRVTGAALTTVDVAKLWHFLSIDKRVKDVNLKSVGITESTTSIGVNFEFEGTLNSEFFK